MMPDRYTCDGCGQVWTIVRDGSLNRNPIKRCPGCGAPKLRATRDYRPLEAACFKGIDNELLVLLYQDWATAKSGPALFRDHVLAAITEALAELKDKDS